MVNFFHQPKFGQQLYKKFTILPAKFFIMAMGIPLNKWYSAERWFLWFRAGCNNKLSIFKTNMFVEAHWKVLKRDFLYKFFRSRLDLVVFVIMKQVVPHNQRKFEQLFVVK